MSALKITKQTRFEIVIGNDLNNYIMVLPFPKWSTCDKEQKKLSLDPDNLKIKQLANKILNTVTYD